MLLQHYQETEPVILIHDSHYAVEPQSVDPATFLRTQSEVSAQEEHGKALERLHLRCAVNGIWTVHVSAITLSLHARATAIYPQLDDSQSYPSIHRIIPKAASQSLLKKTLSELKVHNCVSGLFNPRPVFWVSWSRIDDKRERPRSLGWCSWY